MKKLFLFLSMAVFLAGCSIPFLTKKLPQQDLTLATSKGDIELTVEVADSSEERQKGLMERKSLGDDEGMWFIFEKEQPLVFWMKNTNIALDVIFFNKEKKAVKIIEGMEPCDLPDLECPRYSSQTPALYALEVEAGFVKENGIQVGDFVK